MGRPLTGSIRQASPGSWEASVPERRGSTKRVIRFFPNQQAAEQWLKVACAAVINGLEVPEPAPERHWLVQVADVWFERVYGVERRAGPKRAEAVRGHLDRYILPYFTARWATPAHVDVDDCQHFVHFIAGRRHRDGRLVGVGEPATAIRRNTQGNIIAVVKEVLAEAVLRRIVAFNPAANLVSVAPSPNAKMRTKSKSSGGCTLARAYEIAGMLHLIHQLALWLQRIIGLRISEVYGITVGDVFHDGDTGAGFVLITSQGGGNFEIWNDDGEVETTRRVEHTKTAQSYRVAAVPRPLMALIDLVIDIYHRDANGEVNPDAPLVPGIAKLDGGRDRYREVLKEASITDGDTYLCPHELRKSMVRDLTHKTGIPGEIRRLLLGHLAGGDVHDRIYNGHALDLEPLRKPRDEMEAIIAAEIGTLLVPTEQIAQFWEGHPMRAHRDRAEDMLAERGLLLIDRSGISTEEAGLRIGRSPQVVRRYLEQGLLVGHKIRVVGSAQWVVDEASVQAFVDRYTGVYTYQDFEEDLNLTAQQVRTVVAFLGLQPVFDTTIDRYLFTAEDYQRMVDHRDTVARVKERSMPLERAAEVLKRRRSTLQNWVGRGLDLDPEAELAGLKAYVTRESVERVRQELASSTSRSRALPGRASILLA